MIGEQRFRTEVGETILRLTRALQRSTELVGRLATAVKQLDERVDRLEAHVEERTAVRRQPNPPEEQP